LDQSEDTSARENALKGSPRKTEGKSLEATSVRKLSSHPRGSLLSANCLAAAENKPTRPGSGYALIFWLIFLPMIRNQYKFNLYLVY